MAPSVESPRELLDELGKLRNVLRPCPNEEIVISGVSGRFPEASSVEEFKTKLYEGVDLMIEDDRRWPAGIYGLPRRGGKLKNEDFVKFDASFFGINSKLADQMDPQLRSLVECTHEALLDAGINPVTLRGSRTGVFVASCCPEALKHWTDDPERVNGYGMLGGAMSMVANRISFAFDFKGPSYHLDTSCSSGLYALDQAVTSIRTGVCDSCIVAGSNLLLYPMKQMLYKDFTMLACDRISKPLDNLSGGFERSDAVVVLFIQKKKVAKRAYATVLATIQNTDGFKEDGVCTLSYEHQRNTAKELLDTANITAKDLAYVEMHAMGTLVGDSIEANALADIFCAGRADTLLIGSVKSNMGHSEAAAGLCSILKAIFAMETGIIAPNLHFDTPNENIRALKNSKMKVVTEHTPLRDGVIAVNSIGLAGSTAMVLLKSDKKPKQLLNQNDKLPKLVCVSGRNIEAVDFMLNKVIDSCGDEEFVSLVNDIFSKNIPGYGYKGYGIVAEDKVTKEIEVATDVGRPVWFVFDGVGSQWAGMARELIKIPVCQETIADMCNILIKEGYDLYPVIMSEDESTFDSLLNSLCCIAAVQIALVNLLHSLKIEPDGIIGHSAGEVACAYADGTLTAEEAMLAAYFRGISICTSNSPPGVMAAVGMSWEETCRRVPEGVYPACHNSADSVTISGPEIAVHSFIAELKAEGIFAREVKSSGYAFHSKYIAAAGPLYGHYLKQVIKNPKRRTSRWISTCFPEDQWSSPASQYSSPDYHVINLTCPVLFEEGLRHVPKNAVLIEIAPHHLMQSVLKRALGPDATVIGLLKRHHKDNLQYLLSNMGKAYIGGVQMHLNSLLQTPVEYPVSCGTPMIQSMVKWDHSSTWVAPDFSDTLFAKTGMCEITVDLSSEEYSYIKGHVVDGRIILPGVGYLEIAWKVFAKLHKRYYREFPVVFEKVQFMRATIIPNDGTVTFKICYLAGSGKLEITEGTSIIMRCYVRPAKDPKEELLSSYPEVCDPKDTIIFDKKSEIYKLFVLLGFNYTDPFLGINKFDIKAEHATLDWNDSYAAYIDTMLQSPFYAVSVGSLHLPVGIDRIYINPIMHQEIADSTLKEEGIPCTFYDDICVLKSGGVEIRGLHFNLASQKSVSQPTLHERYTFVPYFVKQEANGLYDVETKQIVRLFTHIMIENCPGCYVIKVIENGNKKELENLYALEIMETIESVPLTKIEAEVTLVMNDFSAVDQSFAQNRIKLCNEKDLNDTDCNFVVTKNTSQDGSLFARLVDCLIPGGFLITEEDPNFEVEAFDGFGLNLISLIATEHQTFVLLRKPAVHSDFILVNMDDSLKWVGELQTALNTTLERGGKILLVSEKDPFSGILGFVNCLKMEPTTSNIRCVFIQDELAPQFSLSDQFYTEQLKKDLLMNVYQNGSWGSFRHLVIPSLKENKVQTPYAYADTLLLGDISTVHWIEDMHPIHRICNQDSRKLCYVYYATLGRDDIKMATLKSSKFITKVGVRKKVEYIGTEFSGRDESGKRVMGFVPDKALASTVFADSDLLWEVPVDWSLDEACTVPSTYSTVYYALMVKGNIKAGESILIHDASSSLVYAAVSICLNLGCTVFVTGNIFELTFIKNHYEGINEDHLINTSTVSVEYKILKETKGNGVNVLFNTVGDQQMRKFFSCLSRNGRFLDIRRPERDNPDIDFGFLHDGKTYCAVYPESFFQEGEVSRTEKAQVAKLVSEGLKDGSVAPFMTTLFTDLDKAFSFVAEGNFIGKVCIVVKEEEYDESEVEEVIQPATLMAIRRVYFKQNKSYIVIGGYGGFGIELCKHMKERCVRNLIIVSRSGPKTATAKAFLWECKKEGVNVLSLTNDCSSISEAEMVIKVATILGPVGGIFNLAAVLKDSLFENLSTEDFEQVLKPKLHVTKNFDILSRKLCPELDYFVTFSSISCGRGNAGQTNYGMANSTMDRICERRAADGYPGISIQWGAIGDVGLVLERMLMTNDMDVGGIVPQRLKSCLSSLDYFLRLGLPVFSTMVLAEKKKDIAQDEQLRPTDVVAKILGIKDVNCINKSSTLVELGTDSLTNVEIKQTLERKFGITLSAQEILQLTFTKLAEMN